eukprot:scaffold48315_cov64-Phaeocystis_antarctica.AAC.5
MCFEPNSSSSLCGGGEAGRGARGGPRHWRGAPVLPAQPVWGTADAGRGGLWVGPRIWGRAPGAARRLGGRVQTYGVR